MGNEHRDGPSGRLRAGSLNQEGHQSVFASGAPVPASNANSLEPFHQFQKNFNTFLENLPKATNLASIKTTAYRSSANLFSSFDGQWSSPADENQSAAQDTLYGSPHMDTTNGVSSPTNIFDPAELQLQCASVRPSTLSIDTRCTQAPSKRPASPTSIIESSLAATVYSPSTIPDFDFPGAHNTRSNGTENSNVPASSSAVSYMRSGSPRQGQPHAPQRISASNGSRKDLSSRFVQMGEECQRLLELCRLNMQNTAPSNTEDGNNNNNNNNNTNNNNSSPLLFDSKIGVPSFGGESFSSLKVPASVTPGLNDNIQGSSPRQVPLLTSSLNVQVVNYIHSFIEQSLKLYRMTQDLYERLREEQQPELSLMSLVPIESFGTNMPNPPGNHHFLPKIRRPPTSNANLDYSDTFIRQYVNASLAGMLNLEAEESAGNSNGSCHRYMRTNRSPATVIGGVEHINGYKVLKMLGYGATSKVRLCSNISSRRYVAVKSVILRAQKPKMLAQPSEFSAFDSGSYCMAPVDQKASPKKTVPAPPPAPPIVELSPAEVEIRILRRLTHPYIIPLEEVIDDEEENMVHLVLGFVSRGPVIKVNTHDDGLNKTTCGTVRPFSKLARYVQEIMEALVHVHNHDFVHNDVKPDNILLDEEDHVKLIDFGVSRRVPHAYRLTGHISSTSSASMSYNYMTSNTHNVVPPDSSLFISNGVDIHGKIIDKLGIGTPAFAAPELIGENDCSAHSDTWSLGVVMFGMLFGYLPFSTRTIRETIDEVLLKPIEFPPFDEVPNNELNEKGERDLSEADYLEWIRVCTGLLQREPHARWPLPYVLKHRFFQFELAEPLHPHIYAHMKGGARWSAEVFNSARRSSAKSGNINADSHETPTHASQCPAHAATTPRSMSTSATAENPLPPLTGSFRRSSQWEDHLHSTGNTLYNIVDFVVDDSVSSYSHQPPNPNALGHGMDKTPRPPNSQRGRSPPSHLPFEKTGARSTHEVVIQPPADIIHRHSLQLKNRSFTGTFTAPKESDHRAPFVPQSATSKKNGNANFSSLLSPTPVMVQNFFSGRLSPANESKETPAVVINTGEGVLNEPSSTTTGFRQLSRAGKRGTEGLSENLPRNASVTWQHSSKGTNSSSGQTEQNSNSSSGGCTSSSRTTQGGTDIPDNENNSRPLSTTPSLSSRTSSFRNIKKPTISPKQQSVLHQKKTEALRPAFSGTEIR